MEIDSGSEELLSDEDYFNTDSTRDKSKLFSSKGDESEEEVYDLLSGESEDDDDEDQGDELANEAQSSSDEDENDGLPDSRAWGKKRKTFYDADNVEPDYFGRDAEALELEEIEARNIQERLTAQLDAGTNFSMDILTSQDDFAVVQEKAKEESETPMVEEKVHADLSKLSKRQKLELLQRESPEFFGLVKDLKEKMMEMIEKWQPMVDLFEKGKLKSAAVEAVVRARHELLLNYCTHIGFYLLLKSKRISVRSHPIVKRLYQLRELINTSQKVGEDVEEKIEEILKAVADGEHETIILENTTEKETKRNQRKKKLLNVLKQGARNGKVGSDEEEEEKQEVVKKKIVTGMPLQIGGRGKKKVSFITDDGEDNVDEVVEGAVAEKDEMDLEDDGEGKRAITYQMSKNKGLTPRRKKEQRNPRVKHRNKFRKAKIRRKGQVREVRSESSRYGGEIFGVKASVSKSIKIK